MQRQMNHYIISQQHCTTLWPEGKARITLTPFGVVVAIAPSAQVRYNPREFTMVVEPIKHRTWSRPSREWVLLAAMVIIAAFLRFAALDTLPPGLYRDEAYNGLDALDVLRGQTPLFFEANNGREPLFIYLEALGVALLGRSPGALRIVSAMVGALTIPVFYWLTRELFGRRVATYTAILALTTVWTLNLSRVAFRAVTLPPIAAVALALLWRGLAQRRPGCMVLAGAVYGLTFYTYLAARFSIVALAVFIVYCAIWRRERFWLRGWFCFAAAALVIAAPLGVYFLAHWDVMMARAGQVSVFSEAINHGDLRGTLLRHVGRVARGFFYRGDFIPRHNVPLRPVFDPLIGLAFLAGIGLALYRARRDAAYGLTLIWFGVMLLPTILAEDAPHMLRGSGVLPTLFILPALGLAEFVYWMERKGRAMLAYALIGAVLAFSAGQSVAAYARHLHSEAVYYNFEAGATELAVEINRYLGSGWQGQGLSAANSTPRQDRQVYLASRLWRDWPSVRFLCAASDALVVLPERGVAPKPNAPDVMLALWPFEPRDEALALLPSNRMISVREGARERGDLEKESRLLYVLWRSEPPDNAPRNVERNFEQGIRLLGYRIQPSADEQTLTVSLYWQAMQSVAENYTVFCHIVSGGGLIGQHDSSPAGGYYATMEWRPGDIVEDRHKVALSSPYDPSCQVIVGLYRLETMQRLAVLDAAGAPTSETSLTLK